MDNNLNNGNTPNKNQGNLINTNDPNNHSPSSSINLVNVVNDILGQVILLLSSGLILVVVYLRKRALNFVQTEAIKSFKKESELKYNLLTLLNKLSADRVLLYEFNSKNKLIIVPKLQVTKPGIDRYVRTYDNEDMEEGIESILTELKKEKDNLIKSIVNNIDNDYLKGDYISNGIMFIVNKLLIFGGKNVGLLVIHYCNKEDDISFQSVNLTNLDPDLFILLNTLSRKNHSILQNVLSNLNSK